MDHQRFDAIARLLARGFSRRDALIAALGGTASLAAGEAAAKRDRTKSAGDGPWPAGPCGPTGKDNICRKDKDCCTGYCKKGKKGKPGRCRCLKVGKPCKSGQRCCGDGVCFNGSCTIPRATGQPCSATDLCADPSASCTAYDSDNPGGTWCLLPSGAACTGANECYSQDCAANICAPVACDVCATCTFTDLASALATPPADGRIRIAPGDWISPASPTISQDLRIEACGGASGVNITPTGQFLFSASAGVTATFKNLNLSVGTGSPSALLFGQGTSGQTVVVRARGVTFDGGSGGGVFGIASFGFADISITDCTFTNATVFVPHSAATEPSALNVVRSTFGPRYLASILTIAGYVNVTVTDSIISGGSIEANGGGIQFTSMVQGTTSTLRLDGTTAVTGNTSSGAGGGGGIGVEAFNGGNLDVVLADSVTVTGNTAPTPNGSGMLVTTSTNPVSNITVTGASGRVFGNFDDPQCARKIDSSFSIVANCAY